MGENDIHEVCVLACVCVYLCEVWIPLTLSHLFPVNHVCPLSVKTSLKRNTLEDVKYIGCFFFLTRIPAFTQYIKSTQTQPFSLSLASTVCLGVLKCLCYRIHGSLANKLFLFFFFLLLLPLLPDC